MCWTFIYIYIYISEVIMCFGTFVNDLSDFLGINKDTVSQILCS